jgi:hypothetical protein
MADMVTTNAIWVTKKHIQEESKMQSVSMAKIMKQADSRSCVSAMRWITNAILDIREKKEAAAV